MLEYDTVKLSLEEHTLFDEAEGPWFNYVAIGIILDNVEHMKRQGWDWNYSELDPVDDTVVLKFIREIPQKTPTVD